MSWRGLRDLSLGRAETVASMNSNSRGGVLRSDYGDAFCLQFVGADTVGACCSARWFPSVPLFVMAAFELEDVVEESAAFRSLLMKAIDFAHERLRGFFLGFLPFRLLDVVARTLQVAFGVRVNQQRIEGVDVFTAETEYLARGDVHRDAAILVVARRIFRAFHAKERLIQIDWYWLSFLRGIERQNLRRWFRARNLDAHRNSFIGHAIGSLAR